MSAGNSESENQKSFIGGSNVGWFAWASAPYAKLHIRSKSIAVKIPQFEEFEIEFKNIIWVKKTCFLWGLAYGLKIKCSQNWVPTKVSFSIYHRRDVKQIYDLLDGALQIVDDNRRCAPVDRSSTST